MLGTINKDTRHIIYANRYWIVFLAFLIVNFTIYRSFVEPGLILAGDFSRAENFDSYAKAYLFPLWSEPGQYSNVLRTHQLSTYAPAIALSSVIDLPSAAVYLVYFMILGSIAGVFMFRLTEYFMQRGGMKIRYEFVLASALIYLFGTAVVELTFHPGNAFAMYLSPVLLYATIRGIEENKTRYLILSSLVFSFIVVDLHFMVFGPIVFLSYILYDIVYKIVVQRRYQLAVLSRAALNLAIILVPGLLLSIYWLIPSITSGGLDLNPNILTKNDSDLLYRNVNIVNALSGKGFFNLQEIYPDATQFSYADVLLILLTAIALLAVFFYRNKFVIFLGIIFVASVIITTVPRYLPDLYNWFMFDIPFSSLYSWAFRAPEFQHFVGLTIAPLIGLSGMKFFDLINTRKQVIAGILPPLFVIVVFLFNVIPNYVLLTGDFNGNHKIYEFPSGHQALISYLGEQDPDYKSIWGPPYGNLESTWSQGRISTKIYPQISPLDVYANDWTTSYYINPLIFGARFPYGSMMFHNETSNVDDFLAPINVKYIVVHNDIPSLESKTERILQAADSSDGLQSKEFGSITLYEVKEPVRHITIKDHTMIIQGGGLSRYESALHIDGIEARETNTFFSDVIGPPDNLRMLEVSDTIIPENELAYSEYMLGQNDVIVLAPFDHTDYSNPSKLWSKSAATETNFLNNFRTAERAYQSDYDSGIIFTYANNTKLTIPVSVSDGGEYEILIRYLSNTNGGIVNLNIGGESLKLNSTRNLNRFVWADLGKVALSQGTQTIAIENKYGFNAINMISLVPIEHYDVYKQKFIESLHDKSIIYVLEAESDLYRTVGGGGGARQISNITYSNGEAILFGTAAKVWGSFEILVEGSYDLSVHGNGKLDVSIDDGKYTSTVQANENENITLQLEPGYHTIEFSTKVRGSDRPYLDYITLQSAPNTDSISSNQVTNFHKVDATNYVANVKAMSPYVLAFAEAYDKGWVAEAETPTGTIQYKPIPLYGIINGFIIDAEGEYPITIRYETQDTFYSTSLLSSITYGIIGSYLIYSFQRNRNSASAST